MQDIAAITSTSFNILFSRLPRSFDLDWTARRYEALLRRREIKSAKDLLHLALAYAAGGLSLRDTAAWAALQGLARMSDVAVLDRLRGAALWLEKLLAAILVERAATAPPGPARRRIRLIDATTVSAPGSTGADWRIHVEYDPAARHMVGIEVTDGRAAESLARFTIGAGEVVIADRCYAKARDLRAVRQAGGDFVVRVGWNALRLRHADGRRFDLFAALAPLGHGEQAEAMLELLPERNRGSTVPLRLVMLRLPAEAAERGRKRARRRGQKQGKRTQPNTLRAAEYVLLATSLGSEVTATDLLELYRTRWQIELLFKRLKSLIGLDDLPADDPDLARTWLYAKLIAALLTEDLARQILDSPPCAECRRAEPPAVRLARPAHAL
jgi:hypothetical protein